MAKNVPVDKVEELREATREANAALKDLKVTAREIRETLDRVEEIVDRADEHIAQELDEWIDPLIKDYLEKYQENIKRAIDEATDAVFKRFNTLYDALMGADREGEPSIPELIQQAVAKASAQRKSPPLGEDAVRATRLLTRPKPALGDQP